MAKAILAPAAVLALWTLIVMAWLATTRFGGLKGVPREKLRELPRVGVIGADLQRVLPPRVNWVSHNYSHLMEQPTVFYAVVLILALVGQGDGLNAQLAWGYTIIRIVHSLWQGLVNTIPVRLGLFALSSACLVWLAINAVRATLL
jgi:hypothetical protein